MKFFFTFILLCSCGVMFGQGSYLKRSKIELNYLSEKGERDVPRQYLIQAEIENIHNQSVWYIIPTFAEDSLPAKGIFTAEDPWSRTYIFGNTYYSTTDARPDGKPKRLTMVHFIGKKQGFYAFRLPAKAKVSLDDWKIAAWKDINNIEIWEVSKLLINGEIPLQDYLQYETEANDQMNISLEGSYFINVDWKKEDLITEISNIQVHYIQAVALSRQRVKFK